MLNKATLVVALLLSATAAWYSISGLTAIFAAAIIPVIIMGIVLETAKIVTSLWLHKYWNTCGWQLKLYLVLAVIILAFITSMGIFGFLSKAHSDQALISSNVLAKLEVFDTKLDNAKGIIQANRQSLVQMDAQVDQLLVRSDDANGAMRAARLRNRQKAERTQLLNGIANSQDTISEINEKSAPLRAEARQLEAEVGPIKYIAALIYGTDLNQNMLESAVRAIIILLVVVFDPLALALIIAAQKASVETVVPVPQPKEEIEEVEEEPMSKGIYNPKYFENHPDEANLDAILYIVVLVNQSTSLRECVKIGITKGRNWKDAIKRAGGFKGYDIRIQKIIPGKLEEIYYLEEYLHELWIDHRYHGASKFGGWTELFSIDKLSEILASVPPKL
jgi:hypothetical protein